MTELGPGKEFDAIRRIAATLGAAATGLGDDCAFLEVGGAQLAISTDSCVERVHFRREWLTLQEVGWRATAAALSDLAAVGAGEPRVLAALTVPDRNEAEPLMTGVGAAAVSVGGLVIGGNVTHGRDLSLTITVVGTVGHPVRRSGAHPGDGLWVTGQLGMPRAALQTWFHGGIPPEAA
ncbi:MAG TPA: AIR synthase related protein, partial [Gemmatimonadales bacterium]|nr:AIR synthase related protein [Gemmatimonadales bacterium]